MRTDKEFVKRGIVDGLGIVIVPDSMKGMKPKDLGKWIVKQREKGKDPEKELEKRR